MASGPDFALEYMVFYATTKFYGTVAMISDISLSDTTDNIRELISERENLDLNYVNLWIVRFYGILC